MSILLYINGYHEQTFGDDQYLQALDRLEQLEYHGTVRTLIFHDGMDAVWLKKVSPRKVIKQNLFNQGP